LVQSNITFDKYSFLGDGVEFAITIASISTAFLSFCMHTFSLGFYGIDEFSLRREMLEGQQFLVPGSDTIFVPRDIG
jgi:hypothetical protein